MKQFALFVVSGGLAALANLSSRFVFSRWMPFEFAVVAAFFVGMTTGFLLMRLYVFDAKQGPLVPQASKYVAVNMFGLAQTLVISVVLARWMLPAMGVDEHVESLSHLVGVLVPVGTSYLGHKFLTFR